MFGKKPEGVQKKKKKRSGIPAVVWMFMGSMLTLMIGVFLYLWQPFKTPGDTEPKDGIQVNRDSKPSTGQKSTQPNKNSSQDGDYQFYDLLPEQDVTPIPDKSISVDQDTERADDQRADVTLKLPSETVDDDVTYTSNDTYDGEPATDSGSANSSQTQTHTTDTSKPADTTSGSQDTIDPIEAIIAKAGNTVKQKAEEEIKKAKKNTYILQINSYDSAEDADKRRAEVLLAGIDAQVVKNTATGKTRYQVISESYESKTAVFMAQQRLQSSGIDAFVVERKK